MPSLIDRVTRFSRSPKGQSMIRDAMSRITGGDSRKSTRKGSRSASRRTTGGRSSRTAGGRSTRTARKR